jgi:predicted permease
MNVWFDLREALRGLRRDRGYSATVIATLALTIGATTAVFSIINGTLLRPLAYRESHQLVAIREVVPQLSHIAPSLPVNPQHFVEWQTRSRSFEAIAEYLAMKLNLVGAGTPVQVTAFQTTGNLFDLLGVGAQIGRTLQPDDDRMNGDRVVVLTDRIWRSEFHGDPAVVGRAIALDGNPTTIVGVLAPSFVWPKLAGLGIGAQTTNADVVVPLRIDPKSYSRMGEFNYTVLARLKPGVTVAQATAELNVFQADIARSVPEAKVDLKAQIIPMLDAVVGTARRGLLLLLAAIGAVLLIACANLANLSLTRTLGRLRDAAVRTALGASRRRLIQRVVLEQLALAVAGGAIGVAAARAALVAFVRTAPIDLPRAGDASIDARVLAFAALVSVVAGLAVAVLPAWRIGSADVQQALRAGGLATTDNSAGLRTRNSLLAVQIALSVALLVVTALLASSFLRLLSADRGFATDHVTTIEVALPPNHYPSYATREPAFSRILENARAVPGVTSLSMTSALPLTGETQVDVISVDGDPRPLLDRPIANYRWVAPDYFRALSIPIVRGRPFDESDHDPGRTAIPVVISARAAERAWPGVDPIGRRFLPGDPSEKIPLEVVGVVADARMAQIDGAPTSMVYAPYWLRNRNTMALVVHTAADPSAVVGSLRQAIWRVDREIAISEPKALDSLVDVALGGRRYQMWLFVAFGFVALLIATIGVYAVTAYGVSRRRRELNIRVALGAQVSQVLGMILRQGLVPIAAGLVAGAAGAAALAGIVASLLFDVRPGDPLVVGAVVAIVGAVGLLACLLAASQGLTINPAAALRDE